MTYEYPAEVVRERNDERRADKARIEDLEAAIARIGRTNDTCGAQLADAIQDAVYLLRYDR